MASNFISYTKHGVAESTLLKATKVDSATPCLVYEMKLLAIVLFPP